MNERLNAAAEELLQLIDRELNPLHVSVISGDEERLYSNSHRSLRENWSWGTFRDGKMHESTPAPLAILWEEGPDDWTLEVTIGRTHRELRAIQDKHDVLFEPYTSWAMGIYDQRG